MINCKLTYYWLAVLALVLPVSALAAQSSVLKGDPVVEWNSTALDIVRQANLAPAEVARDLAILHLAIFEAVNAVEGGYEPYSTTIQVQKGASAEAAAIAAGHRVLTTLFPAQLPMLDERLKQLYAIVPADARSKRDGIEVGRQVAKAILDDRAKDNSDRVVTYKAPAQTGKWRPAPGDDRQALLPHWSGVTPFALDLGSQFRPEPPPALNSAQYAAEVEQVRKLGGRESSDRTAEQTSIAFFWDVDVPALWNTVAENVVREKKLNLISSARTFALLNIALSDAGIATWDTKFRFNTWRPVSAITQAKKAGNLDVNYEPSWMPLITSRAAPEYVSAHAAYSAAAAKVLTSLFGDNLRFTVTSDNAQATGPRTFSSFSQAAEESGQSRIFGGIHFATSNRQGLDLGRRVGSYVIDNVLIAEEPTPDSQKRGL